MSVLLLLTSGAARAVRRAPLVSLLCALCLSAAIGTAAVVGGVIHGLLVQPPPAVAAPEDLFRLDFEDDEGGSGGLRTARPTTGTSFPLFSRFRETLQRFGELAAFYRTEITPDETDRREVVLVVSENYFQVLQTRPTIGALLTASGAGDAPTYDVVLSWNYWQRHFGGDPGVVGRRFFIRGRPLRVVGVAAEGFVGLELDDPALWMSIPTAAEVGVLRYSPQAAMGTWLDVFGRRRREVPSGVLRGVIGVVGPELVRVATARTDFMRVRYRDARLRQGARGARDNAYSFAVVAAALVLLAACANVGGVFTARQIQHRREGALCLALGAPAWVLAGTVVAQGLLLATVGGVAGLGLVQAMPRLARSLPVEPLPALLTTSVVVATILLSLLVSCGVGVLPALWTLRLDAGLVLRTDSAGGGYRVGPLRRALLLTQVALATVLLVAAAAFVNTIRRGLALETLGFRRDSLLVVSARWRAGTSDSLSPTAAVVRAAARLTQSPAVRVASVSRDPPLVSVGFTQLHGPHTAGDSNVTVVSDRVDRDFFDAIGGKIVAGRAFDTSDATAPERRGVASTELAQLFGGAREVVGQCLWMDNADGAARACVHVVGVVRGIRRTGVRDAPPPSLYLLRRDGDLALEWSIVVATRGDPSRAFALVSRQARAELTHGAPLAPEVISVRSIQQLLAPQTADWRLGGVLCGTLASLSLLIALLGLLAVVSADASERVREFAVRTALGAGRFHIVRLVLAEAGRSGLGGAAIGCGASAAALTLLSRLSSTGVASPGPGTYALVFAGVALATVIVSAPLALSASRADVARLLRSS